MTYVYIVRQTDVVAYVFIVRRTDVVTYVFIVRRTDVVTYVFIVRRTDVVTYVFIVRRTDVVTYVFILRRTDVVIYEFIVRQADVVTYVLIVSYLVNFFLFFIFSFGPRRAIIRQGHPPMGFYFILSGTGNSTCWSHPWVSSAYDDASTTVTGVEREADVYVQNLFETIN